MSTDKKWYDILAVIDTKTKVMDLIALVVNGALLATLPFLPSNQQIWSLVLCAAVLVGTLIGMFRAKCPRSGHKRGLIWTIDATYCSALYMNPPSIFYILTQLFVSKGEPDE